MQEESLSNDVPMSSLATETIAVAQSLPRDGSRTINESPFNDPKIDVAVQRVLKYKRTFTVLAFVVPNLKHPLLAGMNVADDQMFHRTRIPCP